MFEKSLKKLQYWILYDCPCISRRYDIKPQFNKKFFLQKAKVEMSNLRPMGHVRLALLPSHTKV